MSQSPRLVIGSGTTSPPRETPPVPPGAPQINRPQRRDPSRVPIFPVMPEATPRAVSPRRTPVVPTILDLTPQVSRSHDRIPFNDQLTWADLARPYSPSPPRAVSPRRAVSPPRAVSPRRTPLVPVMPEATPRAVSPRRTPLVPVMPEAPPRVVSPPRAVSPRRTPLVPVMPEAPPRKNLRIPPPPPKKVVGPRIPPPPPKKISSPHVPAPPPKKAPGKLSSIPASMRRSSIFRAVAARLGDATYELFDITWERPTYYNGNIRDFATNIKWAFHMRHSTRRVFDEILKFSGMSRYFLLELGLDLPHFTTERPDERAKVEATRAAYEVNLLWYLHAADYVMPSMEERRFLSQLTTDGLLEVLGPWYRGPRDRASLIFAAVTGRSTHRPAADDIPRYPFVLEYTQAQIGVLLELYPITIQEDQWASPYGPYVHVALQEPPPYEYLYATVTHQNVSALMETHGIIGGLHPPPHDLVSYFRREIKHYGPVLTRPANQLPPPRLTGLNADQIAATLQFYTLREIVEAYEITQQWDGRDALVNLVRRDAQGGSVWSMRHKWCNNDDTLNIEEGELHGAINKNDPANPTFSYGLQMNYRCYQLEELILAFSPDSEGVIQFKVPDYNPRIPTHDPTTNGPLVQTFPLNSIEQLLGILEAWLRDGVGPLALRNSIARLEHVVIEGIAYNNATRTYFRMIRQEYERFTPEQQRLARIYLTWLFLFGMWIRFWHGPNHPWPYTQTIAQTQAARNFYPGTMSICPRERNEHTFIQLAIKNKIMDQTETPLRRWIQGLRMPNYDTYNGEITLMSDGSLRTYIRSIETGRECQGYAGSKVPRAGYGLISGIFGATGARFDQFLRENLTPVLDMEREVVTGIINHLTGVLPEPAAAASSSTSTSTSTSGRDRRGRQPRIKIAPPPPVQAPPKSLEPAETRTLNVAMARRTELSNPVQNLDPFDPTQLGSGIHTADLFQG